MRNDLIDFSLFFVGKAEEVEVEEGFVEVEKTENGVLAIHGRNGLDTDIEKMRGAVAVDFTLHVARLGRIGGGGNVGARGKLAHKDAVTVAVDVGDWMQDTVNTHTDTNGVAEVFDVDVGSAEFVGLVDEIIEDFLSGNAGEGLRDFGDGGGVAFAGDFDVIILDDFGWIIAEHEDFVGGAGNKEEVGLLAFVGVFLAHAFDDAARGLTGDHELIMLFAATGLEGDNKIMVHLFDSEEVFSKGDCIFEFAGIKIGKTKDATAVRGGLFFVFAAFLLNVAFVHVYIIT